MDILISPIHASTNKRTSQTRSLGSGAVQGNIPVSFHSESNVLSLTDPLHKHGIFSITKRRVVETLHPYQSFLNDDARVFV